MITETYCEQIADTFLIGTTDRDRNEVYYITDNTSGRERSAAILHFFESAEVQSRVRQAGGVFTLADQIELYNQRGFVAPFLPPTIRSFTRTDSSGDEVLCKLVIEGNHRVALARVANFAIEVFHDCFFGNLGAVRNRHQLTDIFKPYLYQTATIWNHGQFERMVALPIEL